PAATDRPRERGKVAPTARNSRRHGGVAKRVSVGARGVLGLHLGADLLAQRVDRHHAALAAEMPIGPTVAGRRALQRGPDLMDRALHVIADQAAVGADLGLVAAVERVKLLARTQHAALDDLTEGHARFGAFAGG